LSDDDDDEKFGSKISWEEERERGEMMVVG